MFRYGNTSDKITQTGLIGDETDIIKFTIWESANLAPMEEEFTGAVVDIQSGSCLIKRCPECNRQVKNGIWGEHGKVEGYMT